ncbi:uncharacterized protein LOC122663889 [Telopea speciosissima]|uniref:uncharacterized protein LOC122663889 n=1 Tax=Telopea speciosissima TaxID=54955 RepID=UPI001CC5F37A|nr:uncharacterized protein LOC122663889 [Telopea speciosissima]
MYVPSADSSSMDSTGERDAFGHTQQYQFAIPGSVPNYAFIPFQAPGTNSSSSVDCNLNIPSSHVEAQKRFLQHQIEVLQNQLKLLQQQKPEESMQMGPTASNSRGKATASSSSTISDCGRHGEIDEADD